MNNKTMRALNKTVIIKKLIRNVFLRNALHSLRQTVKEPITPPKKTNSTFEQKITSDKGIIKIAYIMNKKTTISDQ